MQHNAELLKADIQDELNWNKEREVTKRLDQTTKMFTQQVQNFLTQLDQL